MSFWPRDLMFHVLGRTRVPSVLPEPPTAQPLGSTQALTASTRLLALPWNGRPWGPAGLGTVSDTGRALRGLPLTPQGVGSPTWGSQWMDGKLLVSLSLDSAPSSRRVGTGRGGQAWWGEGPGGMASLQEGAQARHCPRLWTGWESVSPVPVFDPSRRLHPRGHAPRPRARLNCPNRPCDHQSAGILLP